MPKQKKKRNKLYRGSDAKMRQPSVIRVEAANRSAIGQWWFERKKLAKPVLIAAGIIAILVWLFSELLRVIF